MQVYRIAKSKHIKDLSGTGAKIHGGRWNHKGTSIIYVSPNRALATVEYIVHVPLSIVPTNLKLATLLLPDKIIPRQVLISELPKNWRQYPAPTKLAALGTDWAKKKDSLLLQVPSVVVEGDFNLLINPAHPDARHVSIVQIENYGVHKRLLREKIG